jgi:PPM family protein phosphatase
MMRYTISHDSRIGQRKNNQDRLAWGHTAEAVFLIVCDGMGGHKHGEVAAQIVVDHAMRCFKAAAHPALDDPARFLADTFLDAHWSINNYTSLRALPLADAPRTTGVACVIQNGRCWIAHCGDSRAYVIRQGRVLRRTNDHSRVQMLVDKGSLSALDAKTHPERNLVFTCLGGDSAPRIDVSLSLALDIGDRLALCSDGVWGPLGDQLVSGLTTPLERAVPLLLNRAEALAGASCDNLSLIALHWEGLDGQPLSDEKTRTLSLVHTVADDFANAPPAHLNDHDIDAAIATIRAGLAQTRPPKP